MVVVGDDEDTCHSNSAPLECSDNAMGLLEMIHSVVAAVAEVVVQSVAEGLGKDLQVTLPEEAAHTNHNKDYN